MIGFIAQEFETVFPGLVTEMKDTVQDEKEDTNAPIFYNDNDTIPDGKKIGDIKVQHNIEITNSDRENELIKHILGLPDNSLDKGEIESIYKLFFSISKKRQDFNK